MVEKEMKSCEQWYIAFIKEFRKRYNNIPEITRKYIWNIDNFNSPCQVISLTVRESREMTYLWVRKDNDSKDLDINCYGPIAQDRFIETAEQILSDKALYKEINSIGEDPTSYSSYGKYLEEQLVWVSKVIRNQELIKSDFPKGHVTGMKFSSPLDGFFWMIYGDITKIDPELIFKEIFGGASDREKDEKSKSNKVQTTRLNKEELVSGYSTYLYPPVWIGEKPIFDFKSKVNGIFIFPIPTHVFVYKSTTLAFSQRGMFFVGNREGKKCITFMNEIIGTALLLGYGLDATTEIDIGEATVTKEKGESRSYTHPESFTRNWQANGELSAITEEQVSYYSQISLEELTNIVKVAERLSVNDETSNHIVFYAYASHYVRERKFQESFLFDWLIIERYLRVKWDSYLEFKELDKNRRKKLRGWNIDYVLEELSINVIIDQQTYEDISSLKDLRNSLYHKGSDITNIVALKCHKIAERIVKEETNMINAGEQQSKHL